MSRTILPQLALSAALKKAARRNAKKLATASTPVILVLAAFAALTGAGIAYIASPESSFVFNLPFENIFEQHPQEEEPAIPEYTPQASVEESVINTVARVTPSVVSVVATKDSRIIRFNDSFVPQESTETQEVSSGSGFVAGPGLVVTNKHVVADTSADYAIITSTGDRFDATVLALDPVEDLAILKIEGLDLPALPLADSNDITLGQFAITIGNALGEFQNSVSLGVVSGLSRTLTASGPGGTNAEILREVIQTDAAINFGNSGGPLVNLAGQVIGVNVARATQADNIGFAVPINRIKNSLQQARQTGEVKFPFLGVRYTLVTPQLQEIRELLVDYGALVESGLQAGQPSIVPGSAADKAGIEPGDIILEINGKKITADDPLANRVAELSVGDTITLLVLRDGQEVTLSALLGERP